MNKEEGNENREIFCSTYNQNTHRTLSVQIYSNPFVCWIRSFDSRIVSTPLQVSLPMSACMPANLPLFAVAYSFLSTTVQSAFPGYLFCYLYHAQGGRRFIIWSNNRIDYVLCAPTSHSVSSSPDANTFHSERLHERVGGQSLRQVCEW